MAAVIFGFGNHPGVDESDALVIVELLGRTRNMAAVRAAGKIEGRARGGGGLEAPGEEIDLDGDEMIELYALLSAPSATPKSDAISNLYVQLNTELTGSDA